MRYRWQRGRILHVVVTMLIGSLALLGLSVWIDYLTRGRVDDGTVLLALGVAVAFLLPLGLLGALIDDMINRDNPEKR